MLENPSFMGADSVTPIVVDPGATAWNDRFLGHWVDEDRPALVWSGGAWSGRELVARAAGGAALLSAAVPRGQPVPALIDESADALALAAGGALAARPLAPLGTRLPATDLLPAVRSLGATIVIAT